MACSRMNTLRKHMCLRVLKPSDYRARLQQGTPAPPLAPSAGCLGSRMPSATTFGNKPVWMQPLHSMNILQSDIDSISLYSWLWWRCVGGWENLIEHCA